MNSIVQTIILVVILGTGLVNSPAVDADEVRVSMNDAVTMVQQRFNATAVKTETVRDGDRVIYRIRLVSADHARVWTVTVDAQTGQVR